MHSLYKSLSKQPLFIQTAFIYFLTRPLNTLPALLQSNLHSKVTILKWWNAYLDFYDPSCFTGIISKIHWCRVEPKTKLYCFVTFSIVNYCQKLLLFPSKGLNWILQTHFCGVEDDGYEQRGETFCFWGSMMSHRASGGGAACLLKPAHSWFTNQWPAKVTWANWNMSQKCCDCILFGFVPRESVSSSRLRLPRSSAGCWFTSATAFRGTLSSNTARENAGQRRKVSRTAHTTK